MQLLIILRSQFPRLKFNYDGSNSHVAEDPPVFCVHLNRPLRTWALASQEFVVFAHTQRQKWWCIQSSDSFSLTLAGRRGREVQFYCCRLVCMKNGALDVPILHTRWQLKIRTRHLIDCWKTHSRRWYIGRVFFFLVLYVCQCIWILSGSVDTSPVSVLKRFMESGAYLNAASVPATCQLLLFNYSLCMLDWWYG